jgi:hypothetical protein
MRDQDQKGNVRESYDTSLGWVSHAEGGTHTLRVFENKVLKRIFGPERENHKRMEEIGQ